MKMSHDGYRAIRDSQRSLSPNGAQTLGRAALMTGRFRARSAKTVSARWCAAGGAACRKTSSSDARARIRRLLRGSEPKSVLHLAEAFLPRPSASAAIHPCNCHKKSDRCYMLPIMRRLSRQQPCVRCRKKKARCAIFRAIARHNCKYRLYLP